jgi:hypothetical protein
MHASTCPRDMPHAERTSYDQLLHAGNEEAGDAAGEEAGEMTPYVLGVAVCASISGLMFGESDFDFMRWKGRSGVQRMRCEARVLSESGRCRVPRGIAKMENQRSEAVADAVTEGGESLLRRSRGVAHGQCGRADIMTPAMEVQHNEDASSDENGRRVLGKQKA